MMTSAPPGRGGGDGDDAGRAHRLVGFVPFCNVGAREVEKSEIASGSPR
jgi:hypothetical protein